MEARLEWVGAESGILSRIRFQVQARLEAFADKPDTNQRKIKLVVFAFDELSVMYLFLSLCSSVI